jgi:hypothetical protein
MEQTTAVSRTTPSTEICAKSGPASLPKRMIERLKTIQPLVWVTTTIVETPILKVQYGVILLTHQDMNLVDPSLTTTVAPNIPQ